MSATIAVPPAGLRLCLEGVSLRRSTQQQAHKRILDAVTLQVAAGEQVAIVGPSGAGKSSLLLAAAAALRPDGGVVRLDGTDPWAAPSRQRQCLRRALFLAPQVPPLPPRQRVVTAVLAGRLPAMGLWRSLRSLAYPDDIAGAYAALAALGVEDRLFDRVDRLSGGERQRVSLARALVAPARLWLLDEPLAALDPVRAADVLAVLCDQARQRGITLLVSLHQADLAQARFSRIVGLRAGAVAFDGATAQLSARQWQDLYAGEVPVDPLSAALAPAAPMGTAAHVR